jgi:hypothetical protein
LEELHPIVKLVDENRTARREAVLARKTGFIADSLGDARAVPSLFYE